MKNKKGFTLVELLAVILILGVLMGIAVPAIMSMNKRFKIKGFDDKIELIEKAAVNYAQNNANAIKSQINPYIGGGCNEVTANVVDVNSSKAKCAVDPGKGVEADPNDLKYVFYINLKTLLASGDYKPEVKVDEKEENASDICRVPNPLDATKCLDCMIIEVGLDNDYKNATARYGKTWEMTDEYYSTLSKTDIETKTCNNIITPLP